MDFKHKVRVFLHRLRETFSDLNRELSWTLLASFGNTPIAKATLLAPILAQTVYYSSDLVKQYVGLENALGIYWSLISVSIGQLIYSLTCPREIKQYGNDIERFTIEAISTKTENWLENTFVHRIRSNYEASGGTWEFPDYDRKKFETELRREFQKKNNRFMEFETVFLGLAVDDIYNEYTKFRSLVAFSAPNIQEIDWQILARINELLPLCTREPVKPERYELVVLNNALQEKGDGSWKFGTLGWVFYSVNLKLRSARMTVAFFYVVGSLYLIFSALRNIYRMIRFSIIELSA